MSITEKEVEEVVRSGLAAWERRDVEAIVANSRGRGLGFGYRTKVERDRSGASDTEVARWTEAWLGTLENYRLRFEELHAAVDGDIGLAWGVYIEEFQHKGQPPERARVRFTTTLKMRADGWESLLYHRDIQPFDEDGNYPRSLTQVGAT